MEEKLVVILNEMAEYLSVPQMKKLQEVLISNLSENSAPKTEISNMEYLQMFLEAKKIEGCSNRTLQYYRVTVEKLFDSIVIPVRKISTETIREYLSRYQQINNCSKVTVDNIRRNISSFFSWLEEEDYILKSPMRRIHKVKTAKRYIANEMFDNAEPIIKELLAKNPDNGQLLLLSLYSELKVKDLDGLLKNLDDYDDIDKIKKVIENNDKEIGEKIITHISELIYTSINSDLSIFDRWFETICEYNFSEREKWINSLLDVVYQIKDINKREQLFNSIISLLNLTSG